MLNIVIADDHPIVRKGLIALLEEGTGYKVIGETSDGLEALDLVDRLHPDILLVDVMMPGLGGLEITRRVTKSQSHTRVVVLSMHANESYVLEALRSGAHAYVLKASGTDHLVTALREAMAGRRYLSPPLAEHAIQAYVDRAASAAAIIDPYEMLTTREREVLHLAAEGCTNNQIADRLTISPRTAETHRANMMRKLGLRNQAELLKYALGRGIISDTAPQSV